MPDRRSPATLGYAALTRRRDKDRHQESCHVYFGEVQVGWIGERAGVPKDVEQWGWHCGFYPVLRRAGGVAVTFDQARSEFEAAWRDYLPRCTEDDFAEHRYRRYSRPRAPAPSCPNLDPEAGQRPARARPAG